MGKGAIMSPQKKRNPRIEDSGWLGGRVDKKVVAKFDENCYRVSGKARAHGKPAPTRLQYLA